MKDIFISSHPLLCLLLPHLSLLRGLLLALLSVSRAFLFSSFWAQTQSTRIDEAYYHISDLDSSSLPLRANENWKTWFDIIWVMMTCLFGDCSCMGHVASRAFFVWENQMNSACKVCSTPSVVPPKFLLWTLWTLRGCWLLVGGQPDGLYKEVVAHLFCVWGRGPKSVQHSFDPISVQKPCQNHQFKVKCNFSNLPLLFTCNRQTFSWALLSDRFRRKGLGKNRRFKI